MTRNFIKSPKIFAFVTILIIMCCIELASAQQYPGRFFVLGSGSLHLRNLRNAKEARINLLNTDGSINEEALNEVDRVFGFPTAEKREHISPRLLFMLSSFSDQIAPGRTINIESGYRSPDYNNKIRERGANAAKTSTHIDGMALDFWIEGVDGKYLWETIRAKNCCGVGHYGDRTIHLDAGRPRFWQASTSGTGSKEPDYNRHIYLSTDFDRYHHEEKIRLALSGISTFGFGVKSVVHLYHSANLEKPLAPMQITTKNTNDCLMINDRMTSRFLSASLPPQLPAGRYAIRIDVCKKPFEQMPSEIVSNEIELIR